MNPQVSVSPSGGYVVWQDNAVDGKAMGIAARRLDQSFSAPFGAFRVNQIRAGYQEKPQVTMMQNGRAAITWQGGRSGYRNIYLRMIETNGTFTTLADIQVNTFTNGDQSTPTITCLDNGSVALAWSSFNQDGSMQGVFGRVLARSGWVGKPFRINQFTKFNQRSPSIAGLSNGNFVVTWVSENQDVSSIDLLRNTNRVHVYARIFTKAGLAVTSEFRINMESNICANPVVAGSAEGFTVAWAQTEFARPDGWDIYARHFAVDGTPSGDAFRVNTFSYGDQFAPRICTLGEQQLVTWTSMGQDGSGEGVFGQLLTKGVPNGSEIAINSKTSRGQLQQSVASDGKARFLVAWSSYMGNSSFDVQAQRYSVGQPDLPAPEPPSVTALSQTSIGAQWADLSGLSVKNYELFIDGSANPAKPLANMHVATGFEAGSTHSFQVAYVLNDGRRSEKSAPANGKTWGVDALGANGGPDGLPDDWQLLYFGRKPGDWPSRDVDSDGDGASNWQEFLAGTDPKDPKSVLKTKFMSDLLGRHLNWNTQPGYIYQVQSSANFSEWQNFGSPRRAAGAVDSVLVDGTQPSAFYRIIRVQ